MADDLKPLAEKLTAKEPLTLDDFTVFFAVIKEARADGRISLLEYAKIARAAWSLVNDILDAVTGGGVVPAAGGFGFQDQPKP